MPFRKILFWSHLSLAIPAALFIFIMSASGVLLTYEHAILNWVAAGERVDIPEGAERMTVDEIAEAARAQAPDAPRFSLRFANRDEAPVEVSMGRSGGFYLNPYTGEPFESRVPGIEDGFHTIMYVHRWLALEGESRSTGKLIMGISNLVFLFLIVSGLYLWLPKIFKWPFFRQHLFFMKKYPTAKARDYNWHHVFGIWALIPLFLIALSGAVISFPWARGMVYAAFGEEAPQRGRGGGGSEGAPEDPVDPLELASLQQAFDATAGSHEEWYAISFTPPAETATTMDLTLYRNAEVLPKYRTTVTYDRASGEVTGMTGFDETSTPGRKAAMWMRFIHTGEQYGIVGSTIAGLASLAACFLAYTGLALSWRRLIMPLFRKRKKKAA